MPLIPNWDVKYVLGYLATKLKKVIKMAIDITCKTCMKKSRKAINYHIARIINITIYIVISLEKIKENNWLPHIAWSRNMNNGNGMEKT